MPVWKCHVCAVSTNFKKALSGNFREGKDLTISLPDVMYSTIVHFLEWLYSRQLVGLKGKKADTSLYDEMLGLYIFSDRYIVPQLKQDVLCVMFSSLQLGTNPAFSTQQIVQACENLPPKDPLLKLLVEKFWRDVKIEDLSDVDDGELPPRLFLGLSLSISRLHGRSG